MAGARSQEPKLNPGFPHGRQESNYLDQCLLPLRDECPLETSWSQAGVKPESSLKKDINILTTSLDTHPCTYI